MKRSNGFQPRTPRRYWIGLAFLAFLILPGRGLLVGQNTTAPAVDASATAGTEITGNVLDASGKPAADVPVAALVRSPTRDQRPGPAELIAQGRTDERGSFHLTGRAVAIPKDAVLAVEAYRPASAVVWKWLAVGTGKQPVTLQLDAEQSVELQAIDDQGKPVDGLKISIQSIARNSSEQHLPIQWTSVAFPSDDIAGKPQSTTTDAQGRAAVQGIHRGDIVGIQCSDPRFAPEAIDLQTTDGHATLTVAPPKPVAGTVHFQDGGDIAAGATVRITAWHSTGDGGYLFSGAVEGPTNNKGEFSLVPNHAEYLSIIVDAPNNGKFELLHWENAARVLGSMQSLLIPKGVVIEGSVVEDLSGKPVAGATVSCGGPRNPFLGEAITGTDGKFVITADPGHGALLVRAPTPDFIKQDASSGQAIFGHLAPSGTRLHPDGLALLDFPPGARRQQITIRLRRGITIHGRAMDPDGKPVVSGHITTTTYAPYDENFSETLDLPIHDGEFAVPGLDPDKEYRVYLVDPVRQFGITAMLSAKAAQPVEITLAPCGSATLQLFDQADHPCANYKLDYQHYIGIELIKAPGPDDFRFDGDTLDVESYMMENADPERYQSLRADGNGRITFPTLIPGADYRFIGQNQPGSNEKKSDFTVRPGQTMDLGRFTVVKPQ